MRFLLGFLFTLILITSAQAMSVSPMSLRLNPNSSASDTVVVRNTTSERIAIEVFVERRNFDQDGAQSLERTEDDILVFPPLANIAPGASQAFRVQFIGDPAEKAGPRQEDESRVLLRLAYAFKVAVRVLSVE